jgi:hypothetical protein
MHKFLTPFRSCDDNDVNCDNLRADEVIMGYVDTSFQSLALLTVLCACACMCATVYKCLPSVQLAQSLSLAYHITCMWGCTCTCNSVIYSALPLFLFHLQLELATTLRRLKPEADLIQVK